jgi:hypothetical protein
MTPSRRGDQRTRQHKIIFFNGDIKVPIAEEILGQSKFGQSPKKHTHASEAPALPEERGAAKYLMESAGAVDLPK